MQSYDLRPRPKHITCQDLRGIAILTGSRSWNHVSKILLSTNSPGRTLLTNVRGKAVDGIDPTFVAQMGVGLERAWPISVRCPIILTRRFLIAQHTLAKSSMRRRVD